MQINGISENLLRSPPFHGGTTTSCRRWPQTCRHHAASASPSLRGADNRLAAASAKSWCFRLPHFAGDRQEMRHRWTHAVAVSSPHGERQAHAPAVATATSLAQGTTTSGSTWTTKPAFQPPPFIGGTKMRITACVLCLPSWGTTTTRPSSRWLRHPHSTGERQPHVWMHARLIRSLSFPSVGNDKKMASSSLSANSVSASPAGNDNYVERALWYNASFSLPHFAGERQRLDGFHKLGQSCGIPHFTGNDNHGQRVLGRHHVAVSPISRGNDN